ncbi:metallophosphoesterase [Candidatus Woesearchaeota archaeon]|nr:metallophosphoesterase [Candidatus Woesearchaeota archaeon]
MQTVATISGTELKKRLIADMLGRGILPSPDIFKEEEGLAKIREFLEQEDSDLSANTAPAVLNKDFIRIMQGKPGHLNWKDIERFKVIEEKKKDSKPYRSSISSLAAVERPGLEGDKATGDTKTTGDIGNDRAGVKVLFNYDKIAQKKTIQDFVKYYNARYKAIESMLSSRQELSGLTSAARILAKRERENVSLIGLVKEKTITPKGHVIMALEDPTSEIKVMVSKSKQDMIELAKDIVVDEVIGVTGVSGDGIVYCSKIVLPEIPAHKELKKCPDEIYALFLSDLHIGSDTFLKSEFEKFLKWINGEIGSPAQLEIIKKIKYIFIAGDLVDGVGIYPGQESELLIKDIYEQYEVCAKLLSRIPKDIQIIVCAGNHDGSRLSEPQLPLSRDFIRPLLEIPNLTMLSNPSIVNIAATEDFPGFDVLLYHGYSFDYYVANVDSIRNSGGYDRADLIMKFLLQRRHLAPSNNSTLHEPDTEFDPLVIGRVPDFFVSGHIHKVAVSSYRGVSLICGSCWQSTTSFQLKMGHHPEPARVPIVNLQTRETKILRF